MSFEIIVHEAAAREIERLRAFGQWRIVDEIEQQLNHEPTLVTRRRKCVGPLAATFEHESPIWQLRVGEFRVFYDVDEQSHLVHVRAVRQKLQPPDNERYPMKSISNHEAQADIDAVLDSAQTERIIVTRDGKPSAVIVGLEPYDEEDLQWAISADFWQMIQERRGGGTSISLSELKSRLKLSE